MIHHPEEKSAGRSAKRPRASVVVCTHNRKSELSAAISSLRRSTISDFEIVVVDDGSDDGTSAYVEGLAASATEPSIVLRKKPSNTGVSAARNTGIEAASGDFILFTDSDCTVPPDWVEKTVATLEVNALDAVAGSVHDACASTYAEKAFQGTSRIGSKAQGRLLIGNNMGFRSEWLNLHKFDPALTYGCDEDDIALRLYEAGARFGYVDAPTVVHKHRMTMLSYLRNAWLQGGGSAKFWYKHGLWIGRDMYGWLAIAIATLVAFFVQGVEWLLAGLLVVQTGALLFSEIAFKGKAPMRALYVLPAVLVHSLTKASAVLFTLVRIGFGLEPGVRASKRALSARRAQRA